jgi:hypothetical protein
MLKVFKVDVLEILRWPALYSTNGRPKTRKRTKTNKTEQQSVDNPQYDAMAR